MESAQAVLSAIQMCCGVLAAVSVALAFFRVSRRAVNLL